MKKGMKKTAAFISWLLFLFLWPFPASGRQALHEVRFVYDGDTIQLANGEKVRYLGINAPEIDHEGGKSEPLAYEARRLNMEILAKHRVRLETEIEKRDHYDRLLAHVFLEDGRLVSELIVLRGLAHVLRIQPNLKYWDRLLEAQRRAMKEGVGIWSVKVQEEPSGYIGNIGSFVFHRKSCPFAKQMSPKKAKVFKKRKDAFYEGFSPCRRCKP
jgi:endonuclease YncB( thermonuclease family)